MFYFIVYSKPARFPLWVVGTGCRVGGGGDSGRVPMTPQNPTTLSFTTIIRLSPRMFIVYIFIINNYMYF